MNGLSVECLRECGIEFFPIHTSPVIPFEEFGALERELNMGVDAEVVRAMPTVGLAAGCGSDQVWGDKYKVDGCPCLVGGGIVRRRSLREVEVEFLLGKELEERRNTVSARPCPFV